jgi:hypothetical protein
VVQKLVRTGYPENHQVSFFWISENWGGYFQKIRNLKKNQAGSLAPLKEPELTVLTKSENRPTMVQTHQALTME